MVHHSERMFWKFVYRDGDNELEEDSSGKVEVACANQNVAEQKKLQRRVTKLNTQAICIGCNAKIKLKKSDLMDRVSGRIKVEISHGRHMSMGCLFKQTLPLDLRKLCDLNSDAAIVETSGSKEGMTRYEKQFEPRIGDRVADYKDKKTRESRRVFNSV